jgi:hypothetical protein
MHDRSAHPLSDADLDRELAAAFAVEPSPEFVARLRLRIEREPAPSSWQRAWVFAAAGACAIGMAASLAVIQSGALKPALVVKLAAVVAPASPAPLAVAAAAASRERRDSRRTPSSEMKAVMNANAAASASVRTHLQQRDYPALARDAETYRQNFTYLEGFWLSQHVEGAVEISRAGLLAASDLASAAHAKDDRALASAIAAIVGTCSACHRHYREELPDGSYEITL